MTNPSIPELAGLRDETAASPDQPRFPSVGLIAFAPHRWGSAWTSRNHVTMSLGRSVRAVWLTPSPEWRLARPWESVPADRFGPEPPVVGFSVDHPRRSEVAVFRPRSLAKLLARRRLERVARSLRAAGCRKLIAYHWRAKFLTESQLIPFDLTVVHLDDEHSFSDRERPVPPVESAALEAADLVFLSSPRLVERKGQFNRQTYLFPNGADLAWYRGRQAIPADLAAIPGPRLGYTGFLRKCLDWPLLLDLARRRPDWQFVFVGEALGHDFPPETAALRGLGNTHFLGYRPSEAMVPYQQHFDVALLPYLVNDYTNCIYPVKLHEYLAAGTPAVGTPIRSLRDFSDQIELASGAAEWARAIEIALAPDQRTPARVAQRKATAARFDWNAMADAAADLMVTRLGVRP